MTTSPRPTGVPASYPYPDVAFTRLLDDAATDFPGHEAVAYRGHRLTYRELDDRVNRCATGLHDLGLVPGDRLVTVVPAIPQLVVLVLAAARLGVVIAPLPADSSSEVIAHSATDLGCRALICEAQAYPRVAGLKGRLPTVTTLLVTGETAYAAFPRNLSARMPRAARRDGAVSLEELIRQSAPWSAQHPVDPARDLLAIVGTFGRGVARDRNPASPWDRGVAFTHGALVAASFQLRLWIPDVVAGRERLLVTAPLHTGFGMAAGVGLPLLAAASLALGSGGPEWIDAEVARHDATLVVGHGEAVQGLATGRGDLSTLRAALASDPVGEEVASRVHDAAGVRVRGGLAVPEAAGLLLADAVYGPARAGSFGLPLPDTRAVVERGGEATPVGEPGELRSAGPQLMRGYWARPGETSAVLADGWLRTGERARLADDGFVWPAPPDTTS